MKEEFTRRIISRVPVGVLRLVGGQSERAAERYQGGPATYSILSGRQHLSRSLVAVYRPAPTGFYAAWRWRSMLHGLQNELRCAVAFNSPAAATIHIVLHGAAVTRRFQ